MTVKKPFESLINVLDGLSHEQKWKTKKKLYKIHLKKDNKFTKTRLKNVEGGWGVCYFSLPFPYLVNHWMNGPKKNEYKKRQFYFLGKLSTQITSYRLEKWNVEHKSINNGETKKLLGYLGYLCCFKAQSKYSASVKQFKREK